MTLRFLPHPAGFLLALACLAEWLQWEAGFPQLSNSTVLGIGEREPDSGHGSLYAPALRQRL
jgi:hypothetical protein